MESIDRLLENNRAWAGGMLERDPDFFRNLTKQQKPAYLWIGCSDSRVPANQIIGLTPGEVFVHRNVANVVVHSDLNCLSVLQFAVDVLQVQHVIVCGHYGCGGVAAALERKRHGLIDNWLRHIQDVARARSSEINAVPPDQQWDRLCELNVLAQREHVCETTIVQDAWERGQSVHVHGWIYGIKDGLIRRLAEPLTSLAEFEQSKATIPAA